MNTIASFFKPSSKVEPKKAKDLFGYFTKSPKSTSCTETSESPVTNGSQNGTSLDDSIILFEDPKPVISKKGEKVPKGERKSRPKKDKVTEKGNKKQLKKQNKDDGCDRSNGIAVENHLESKNIENKSTVQVVSYEEFLRGSVYNEKKSEQKSGVESPTSVETDSPVEKTPGKGEKTDSPLEKTPGKEENTDSPVEKMPGKEEKTDSPVEKTPRKLEKTLTLGKNVKVDIVQKGKAYTVQVVTSKEEKAEYSKEENDLSKQDKAEDAHIDSIQKENPKGDSVEKEKNSSKKQEAVKSKSNQPKRIKTVMLKAYDDTKAAPIPVEEIEDDNPLENTLPKQSNSLFNYFSKGKSKIDEHSATQQVTVEVEIHHEPSPPKEESHHCAKVFDIFRKKSTDQSVPNEEMLKKTPTSNVVVDSKEVEMIILEGTMAVSPQKTPKKRVKRKILDEGPKSEVNPSGKMLNEKNTTSNLDQEGVKPFLTLDKKTAKRKILDEELPSQTNYTEEGNDKNTKLPAANGELTPMPMDAEELTPHSEGLETLTSTTLSPIRAPEDTVDTNTQQLDAEIALLEKKKELAAQMASLDKVKVTAGKSTQATLSFGKAGFTVLKPDKTKAETEEKTKMSKLTPSKKKKGSSKGKKEKVAESRTEEDMEDEQEGDSEKMNRSLKTARALTSIYQASIAKSRNKTRGNGSLKMKITRISGVGDKEVFTPKSKKSRKLARLNKAQELLMKAKISKAKKQSPKPKKARRKVLGTDPVQELSVSEDSGLRRSSRRCAQVTKESLRLQSELSSPLRAHREEKGSDTTPKKTDRKGKDSSGKAKKTPAKTKATSTAKESPKKKSKKASGKMAPIFGRGRKASCDSVVTVSSGGEDVEITKVETDPIVLEHQRIRRAFLFSGVPEKLKKQQEESLAVKLSDYPPFPLVSHVQQAGTYNPVPEKISETEEKESCGAKTLSDPKPAIDPWTLTDVCLPVKEEYDVSDNVVCTGQIASVNDIRLKTHGPKTQTTAVVAEIPDDLVKHLLAEMTTCNPGFPVRRTYRQLVYRRQETYKQYSSDLSENTNKQSQEPNQTTNVDEGAKLSGKKRKLDDSTQGNEDAPAPRKGRKRRKGSTDSEVEIVDVEEIVVSKRTRSSRLSRSNSQKMNSGVCIVNDVEAGDDTSKNTVAQTETGQAKAGSVTVVPSMLWSDKYSPGHSSEVIGNSKVVKKLKSWLTEWKARTDLEARQLRKEQVRQAKKAGKSFEEIRRSFGDEWWTDDESDFDLSDRSDDSDCEVDETLCNTVLLTGPCGVGKTCLVYALAQELGYKVFEVNASSRRNGKQILSQLQEATQSHQVSKKNLDAVYTDYMAAEQAESTPAKPAKTEKKVPSAFASFFGKGEKKNEKPSENKKASAKLTPKAANTKRCRGEESKNEDTKKPKKGKSRKGQSHTDTPNKPAVEMSKKRGLDLASTSLIMFEEADIVFEDDRGFWPAVQTFMSTTKRPILLTANDPNFAEKFKCRVEHYKLRTPSLSTIASYVQSIAVVENLRTSYHDLLSLTEHYRGDIRSCILQLQCWALSGGSVHPQQLPITYRSRCLRDKPLIRGPEREGSTPSKTQPSQPGTGNTQHYDSADEFEVSGPKKKNRRLILDDDSSCDAQSPRKLAPRLDLSVIEEEDSQPSQQSQGGGDGGEGGRRVPVDMTSLPVDDRTPPVQGLLYESTTCTTSQLTQGDNTCLQLAKCLSTLSSGNLSAVISTHKRLGQDILYNNLVHLLPLPKCHFSPLVPVRKNTQREKTRSRILNASDLFDSDSEQGFLSIPSKPSETESAATCNDSGCNKDMPGDSTTDTVNTTRADHKLCLNALQNMCEMYDNLSFCDSYIHGQSSQEGSCSLNPHHWNPGTCMPGDSDVAAKLDSCAKSHHLDEHDICAEIECRTLLRTKVKLSEQLNLLGGLSEACLPVTKAQLSLPIDTTAGRLLVSQERPVHKSLQDSNQKATLAVAKALPCHVFCQRAVVSTEYLPAIRTIFLSEQLRKAGKTKRRFFHYMDDMLVELKESVVDTLCSSFN